MPICDVSVVIPAYNAQNFLIEALESIERQSYTPKEVIVINDGSTDDTFVLVQAWITSKNHNCPIYLFNQANKGVPYARNFGIRQSVGAWVALLDADDIWESCHLAELLSALESTSSAIAAYGAGRVLIGTNLSEKLYDDFWDNPSKKFGKRINSCPYFLIEKNIFPRLLHGNFIKPSSLIFSKKIANDVGLFNESLRSAEDREFLIKLILKGNFVYSPKSITQYRLHDDNLTNVKNSKKNMENGLRVISKIISNKNLDLDPVQKSNCLNEMRSSTKEYLYVCAKNGLVGYINGLKLVGDLFKFRNAVLALNPKHMVHCILSTLKV